MKLGESQLSQPPVIHASSTLELQGPNSEVLFEWAFFLCEARIVVFKQTTHCLSEGEWVSVVLYRDFMKYFHFKVSAPVFL